MDKIISIYKPVGKTPLQMVEELRKRFPDIANEKLGFAGRLDPMAEGLLLVLIGEENKKRNFYERLPKEYVFDILFGITTDTYDSLGLITKIHLYDKVDFGEEKIEKFMKLLVGSWQQNYPPYSSPRINGKPLFYWAREGRLSEILIPSKMVEVYSIKKIGISVVDIEDLAIRNEKIIASVLGEFRQIEIIKKWKLACQENLNASFISLKIQISVSSGTYVRSICHDLGEKVGLGAIALSIKRTRIGDFKAEKALYL
ncbi:MAG: hypothetical protein EXS44_03070 [Candidatus Levybacteria bacterium]|nr:hypothetical protein [Candidatus Levybacteria bacterium]